eukprot:TRINITY_DN4382_c0_g1_i3.p1 TRINITY_DN4382_c0_g1~~TRINITY_DN4382_c0_g1_i3.p1  ORF type:complete len:746 (-),score=204.93 TRINITY_DN4382_c0_g1_i3:108-2345(-)
MASSPLLRFRSYRLSPHFRSVYKLNLTSVTYSHQLDPDKNLCRWELLGVCNDDQCIGQHERQYRPSDAAVLRELASYKTTTSAEEKEMIDTYVNTLAAATSRPLEARAVELVKRVNTSARHPHYVVFPSEPDIPFEADADIEAAAVSNEREASDGDEWVVPRRRASARADLERLRGDLHSGGARRFAVLFGGSSSATDATDVAPVQPPEHHPADEEQPLYLAVSRPRPPTTARSPAGAALLRLSSDEARLGTPPVPGPVGTLTLAAPSESIDSETPSASQAAVVLSTSPSEQHPAAALPAESATPSAESAVPSVESATAESAMLSAVSASPSAELVAPPSTAPAPFAGGACLPALEPTPEPPSAAASADVDMPPAPALVTEPSSSIAVPVTAEADAPELVAARAAVAAAFAARLPLATAAVQAAAIAEVQQLPADAISLSSGFSIYQLIPDRPSEPQAASCDSGDSSANRLASAVSSMHVPSLQESPTKHGVRSGVSPIAAVLSPTSAVRGAVAFAQSLDASRLPLAATAPQLPPASDALQPPASTPATSTAQPSSQAVPSVVPAPHPTAAGPASTPADADTRPPADAAAQPLAAKLAGDGSTEQQPEPAALETAARLLPYVRSGARSPAASARAMAAPGLPVPVLLVSAESVASVVAASAVDVALPPETSDGQPPSADATVPSLPIAVATSADAGAPGTSFAAAAAAASAPAASADAASAVPMEVERVEVSAARPAPLAAGSHQ